MLIPHKVKVIGTQLYLEVSGPQLIFIKMVREMMFNITALFTMLIKLKSWEDQMLFYLEEVEQVELLIV